MKVPHRELSTAGKSITVVSPPSEWNTFYCKSTPAAILMERNKCKFHTTNWALRGDWTNGTRITALYFAANVRHHPLVRNVEVFTSIFDRVRYVSIWSSSSIRWCFSQPCLWSRNVPVSSSGRSHPRRLDTGSLTSTQTRNHSSYWKCTNTMMSIPAMKMYLNKVQQKRDEEITTTGQFEKGCVV